MRSKQRAAIDFTVWLGKDIGETCALLQEVYGKECFEKRTIQHWHKSFCNGHQETGGLPHTGWPCSLIREVTINTAAAVLDEDHHLSVRQLEEVLHSQKMTINWILKDKLLMRCVCSSWCRTFLPVTNFSSVRILAMKISDSVLKMRISYRK